MGRVRFLWVPLLVAVAVGWSIQPVAAQTKEARGTVTAVTDTALTVRVKDMDMKFTVDNSTVVGAPGAGRATRDAQSKGAPGLKLTGLVKVGAGVVVVYREAAGALVATEIRDVPGATAGAAAPTSGTANGTVKSATDTSLVVADSGKDWTFMVDANTRVLAKGAGTATKEAGGKIPFTKLVAVGDTVSVSYEGTAPKMRATEVRITVDANRAPRPAGK
jgi:hypothetical protein